MRTLGRADRARLTPLRTYRSRTFDKLEITGSSPVPPTWKGPGKQHLSFPPRTTREPKSRLLAAAWLQRLSIPPRDARAALQSGSHECDTSWDIALRGAAPDRPVVRSGVELHVQRGDLLRGRLRDAGGGRPILGRPHGRLRRGVVRLAQGSLRRVLADRPEGALELIGDPDRGKSQRVMAAMLRMKKIEIDELERAAAAA
jgi:hypothetical protein